MTYIGVDGCKAGWIAIVYDEEGYRTAAQYETITDLWTEHGSAARILIDVPIGLRESSSRARPCDAAARDVLRPKRNNSVFPTPVRDAAREAYLEDAGYADVKSIQEDLTDGSLGSQAWGIAQKIGELDWFLLEEEPTAQETIGEAHPEVCFWAINGAGEGDAMDHSKSRRTGHPAAAFWERVGVLETIDSDITSAVRDAATDLASNVSNDDLIDAFALALTASPLTAVIERLPQSWPADDDGDPRGLPMRCCYSRSSRGR